MNKNIFIFAKTEKWKEKQVLSRGRQLREWGGYKERDPSAYIVEILCTCICKWKKWDQVRLFQVWVHGGQTRMIG
jgi:hypothetical protein